MTDKYVVIGYYLLPEHDAWIKDQAAKREMSASNYMRVLIETAKYRDKIGLDYAVNTY